MLSSRSLVILLFVRTPLLLAVPVCVIVGATMRPRSIILFAAAAVLWVGWLALRIWGDSVLYRFAADRATTPDEVKKVARHRRFNIVSAAVLATVTAVILTRLVVVFFEAASG